MSRVARQNKLPGHQIPRAIHVTHEPFTPENGLLTVTMKPCRHKCAVVFK
jgi:hypothetical protein